jgi:hypothetical protein
VGVRDDNGKPDVPICDTTVFFLETQLLLRESWEIICYSPLHFFASQIGRDCSLPVANSALPELKFL